MKIKKVLVSQPKPQTNKSPYFDLGKKLGLTIDFRSFIEVKPISGKEFKLQKIKLEDYSSVILTSKTAVDNFFRVAKEIKYEIPDSLKYFCITESIALYLQKYITYRKRKIFFGQRTFDDLKDYIVKYSSENFLLPVSEVHKEVIPGKLKKMKINFSKAIMYRTVSADLSDLKDVNYDILVFYSPSGIKSLFENFPGFKQNGTKIASFGNTTKKAAKAAGLKVDIAAPSKFAPSMTMAIEQFVKDSESAKK